MDNWKPFKLTMYNEQLTMKYNVKYVNDLSDYSTHRHIASKRASRRLQNKHIRKEIFIVN
jgi:hypothetical protein